MFETLAAAEDLLSIRLDAWVAIAGFIATFFGLLKFLYFWGRRKRDERAEEIAETIEEIAAANGRRAYLASDKAAAESALATSLAARDAAAQQIAQLAVAEAWRHYKAGDTDQAADTLLGWWEGTHVPTAEVHGQLAEWYAMFAEADGDAPDAIASAEAARKLALRHFLIAENLAPEEWSGRAAELALTGDPSLDADDELERHFSLPVGLDKASATLLVNRLIERSQRQLVLGQYWATYALAARGSLIASRVLPRSELYLKCEHRRAVALRFAGHLKQALPIAQTTRDAQTAHPDLGANHPDTLGSGYLLAQILHDLGHSDEALPIAQTTRKAMMAHPDRGADHPDTHVSGVLVAQILNELRRSTDALPIAETTRGALTATLGAGDPNTLLCGFLVAQILRNLGRSDEALRTAKDTWDATTLHLGPDHPHTLLSGVLVAQILGNFGRSDEALPIAQDTWKAMTAHPALGADHPDTLACGAMVAQILRDLGRNAEALPIAQTTREALTAHLGADYPDTLACCALVASILSNLGRDAEALPIAQDTWVARKAHPDRGAGHPSTLASGMIVAQILRNLGRNDEALPIAHATWEAMTGADHPETIASGGLVAQILRDLGRNVEARTIATNALAIAVESLAETHPVRRDLAAFVASLDAVATETAPQTPPTPKDQSLVA